MKLIKLPLLLLGLALAASSNLYSQVHTMIVYVNTGNAKEDQDTYSALAQIAQGCQSQNPLLGYQYDVITVNSWSQAAAYAQNNPDKNVETVGHGLFNGDETFTGKLAADATNIVDSSGNIVNNTSNATDYKTAVAQFPDSSKVNFCGEGGTNTKLGFDQFGNKVSNETSSMAKFQADPNKTLDQPSDTEAE